MSFRVQCSENYYGPDCTTFCEPVEGVNTCDGDGRVVCIDERRDPASNCEMCLPGVDVRTSCTTCLLPGYDVQSSCRQCLPGRDMRTNCTTCLAGYDLSTDCTKCLLPGFDPSTSCSQCLTGRDITTNCMMCLLPGYDPSTNCTECLPNVPCQTTQTSESRYFYSPCSFTVILVCLHVGTDLAVTLASNNEINSNNLAVVGGAVGGAAGLLVILLIVLCVVITIMVFQLRYQHKTFTISGE